MRRAKQTLPISWVDTVPEELTRPARRPFNIKIRDASNPDTFFADWSQPCIEPDALDTEEKVLRLIERACA